PLEKRRARLERSAEGRLLLEVQALSPLEFVEHEFENDVIRAGLLFFNGLREVDLRLKGFGHSIPALLAGRHKAQMCLGGSARLAEALVADIREHGGDVRTGVQFRGILVRDRRALGVELETGDRIKTAGFVASGLNPQQTVAELMDAGAVGEFRARAEQFRYNLLAPLFALNLALPGGREAAGTDASLHDHFGPGTAGAIPRNCRSARSGPHPTNRDVGCVPDAV